jgi:hypothetical protein
MAYRPDAEMAARVEELAGDQEPSREPAARLRAQHGRSDCQITFVVPTSWPGQRPAQPTPRSSAVAFDFA